jgi:hypothetical protein
VSLARNEFFEVKHKFLLAFGTLRPQLDVDFLILVRANHPNLLLSSNGCQYASIPDEH